MVSFRRQIPLLSTPIVDRHFILMTHPGEKERKKEKDPALLGFLLRWLSGIPCASAVKHITIIRWTVSACKFIQDLNEKCMSLYAPRSSHLKPSVCL